MKKGRARGVLNGSEETLVYEHRSAYQKELEVALAAVRAASRVAEAARPHIGDGSLPKPDGSPVTIADYAAQAAACSVLAAAFPGDAVVAEESSAALRAVGEEAIERVARLVADSLANDVDAEQLLCWIDFGSQADRSHRFWTLDPIDGTRGYLSGGHYCPALALIENGRVVVGALACPTVSLGAPIEATPKAASGAVYYAVRGGGAYAASFDSLANPRKLQVSQQERPDDARLCQRRTADLAAPKVVSLRKQLGISGAVLAIDSQVKYAAIAQGDADLYIRPRKHPAHRDKIWDHAAGAVLVEEAGGTISDFTGQPLDFSFSPELAGNHGILVSNGRFHFRLVDAASEMLEG